MFTPVCCRDCVTGHCKRAETCIVKNKMCLNNAVSWREKEYNTIYFCFIYSDNDWPKVRLLNKL